jgi:hypothetical protein
LSCEVHGSGDRKVARWTRVEVSPLATGVVLQQAVIVNAPSRHCRCRAPFVLAVIHADYPVVELPLLGLCLKSIKGLGLFAKADIKAGTRIPSENPPLILPERDCSIYHDLQIQLAKLTSTRRDTFHSLSADHVHLRKVTKRDIEREAVLTRKPLKGENQLEMEGRDIGM